MRNGSTIARARGIRLAAVCALAAAAGVAQADILYTTSFGSSDYTNGALVGQAGWARTGTVTTNPLTVSGGSVAMTTGEDANHTFSPAITADSIFLSADFTITSASTGGDYFIHLSDGGTSNFYARIYAKSSGSGFVMAMGTSSGAATYGATELAFGTYHIVARYDFVAGSGNDTGALFINPSDGVYATGATPYVAATTVGIDATSISAVNLRQGGGTTYPAVSISGLTVAAVPTPGSIALLGLGGLVAMRRRRA